MTHNDLKEGVLSEYDVLGKQHWQGFYHAQPESGLWLDDPVPFAQTAVTIFRETGARLVLELPCGDGKNTGFLARHLPFVVAADTSHDALALASNRLKREGVANSLLCIDDALSSQFRNEQFPAIFCCDLLGHLPNSHAALREMVRICMPGGLLVANVFALEDSARTAENMQRLNGNEEYLYLNKFFFRFSSEAGLSKLLAPLNVEVLSISRHQWVEGPHPGYREYAHEHQSWVFVVRKGVDSTDERAGDAGSRRERSATPGHSRNLLKDGGITESKR